ncbi:hypothetical protein HA052_20470 [Chromobacterium haemolyticum]|uniref:Uncharacterized protein n=1 Tax=Chromobacterium fluminis TaxID=3044269 RepID=A0ABX0L6Y7_9NEIS|nr:hypothetical protein [Chromobacterium haemolyticum]NHR07567.1 hypothetical protein [Chromobacterium haemolyticum]
MSSPPKKKGASLTKKIKLGPLKSLENSRPQRIFSIVKTGRSGRAGKLLFSQQKTTRRPLGFRCGATWFQFK